MAQCHRSHMSNISTLRTFLQGFAAISGRASALHNPRQTALLGAYRLRLYRGVLFVFWRSKKKKISPHKWSYLLSERQQACHLLKICAISETQKDTSGVFHRDTSALSKIWWDTLTANLLTSHAEDAYQDLWPSLTLCAVGSDWMQQWHRFGKGLMKIKWQKAGKYFRINYEKFIRTTECDVVYDYKATYLVISLSPQEKLLIRSCIPIYMVCR